VVRVVSSSLEARDVRTLFFEDSYCKRAKPGQYAMIWVPGIDEVPMSLSMIDEEGLSGVTVREVGKGTEALCKMVEGDSIGVRGPYGNWFEIVRGRVAIVGGGTGLAPLLPLAAELAKLGSEVSFVIGGKTVEEVLFREKIGRLLTAREHKVIVTTEDGSYGRRGVVTDAFEDLLEEGVLDMVYTCGPEPMMRKVFDLAENRDVQIQASLERIVRCSIGLCGSCVIGRFRVCKDGLVLSSERLREVADEFGRFKRDFDGRRIYF